jgi:hypothetical protein
VAVKSRSRWIGGNKTKLRRMGCIRWPTCNRLAGSALIRQVGLLTSCSRPAPGSDPNKPHSAAVVSG